MKKLSFARSFKKILISCVAIIFMGISIVAIAGGQGSQPKPPKVSVDLLPAPGSGAWWPSKPLGDVSLPTYDYYGARYLPYLYSIGMNTALLVDYADFFYQLEAQDVGGNKPYKSDITALANVKLTTTMPETLDSSSQMTSQDVESALGPGNITQLSEDLITNTPGTDIDPCTGSGCNNKPSNKEFNADTLLGSSGYPSDDDEAIQKFITFLSGNVNPSPGLGLSSDPDKRKEQLDNSEMQLYILLNRSLVASQSVALSNLNFLAKEREIIPNLGQKAAMTTLPTDGSENDIKNASQLQLEEFLVNRRVGNASWYASVNTAKPIEIQRESLFVLAEIQQQLMQLRLVNERMLAAMSSMQFQLAQLNKSQLSFVQQNMQEASTIEGQSSKTNSN